MEKFNQQRIISLQALRALAFLGIFFSHAGFRISWPTLGVSVFYVMSGFFMIYTYEGKTFDVSIKNNFIFSAKKIKKLYPLHIITMLCIVLLNTIMIAHRGITIRAITGLIGKTFLNITLLQTWVPYSDINVSLNGVAWYLSVTLFLYFMFPYLVNVINKIRLKNLCLISTMLLVMEVFLCIPFIKLTCCAS